MPKRVQHCDLHVLLGGRGGWTGRQRFGLLFFLAFLFSSLTQLGCAGLTNSRGSASADQAPSIITQPASQTVTAGQTAIFLVSASGMAPLSYQWKKNGTAIIGATSSSYTTPAETTSDRGAQFTVMVSNSAGSATSSTATLTVNATPVAITVSPNNSTLMVGNTQQFVGNVTGTSNTAVTWVVGGAACIGAACGTISVNGLYVPPASVPSPATVTVIATSVADPTKSASASVTIVAAVAVLLSISPTSASVPAAGTQLFTASVTGTSNTAVSWSVSGAGCSGSSCGTISTSASSAVYLAPPVPPSPASVNVIATSVADPAKSASASVTVVPVIAVTVSPTNASVPTGTTQQFNASVTETSNTAVAWSIAGAGCSGVACGTINSSGLYTAPAVVPSPATVTITATSVADPTKSGSVNLTIIGSGTIGPVLPTLPQATVDVTMPTQAGTTRNVAAGDATGFQNAINAATCGDTIVLVAGSTYTGNFAIPNKACSGWILIESSALASLPLSGTRVGPSNASNMAKVTSNIADDSPITFQTSSHNWRLIGLEITTTVGLHQYSLVETDVAATSTSQFPNYVIVDRCYVHGNVASAVRRGMDLQGPNMAVVDSYFSDMHDQVNPPGRGADSQALVAWCTGPFLIQNNFLSGASENVMFGGAGCGVTGIEPTDITIVGNWFWKDYTNWLGAGFVVKNLFELKKANRVLVDGNVFDYSWPDGQNGTGILLTPRADGCSTCGVADITFTHNLVRHVASGLETAGADDSALSLPTNRVLIQNDVFTDVSSATYGGDGRGILSLTGGGFGGGVSANNITVDHNSIFADVAFLVLGDSGTIQSYQITNNIGTYGEYGIIGSGMGTGSAALNTYLPNVVYNDLVMLTASGNSNGATWPSGTFWNTTAGAQFANYAGTTYQLLATSPYHNAGTDGGDIGVWDWSTFNTETNNALAGHYPH